MSFVDDWVPKLGQLSWSSELVLQFVVFLFELVCRFAGLGPN